MSYFQDDNRGRNFLNAHAISFQYDESVSFNELKGDWQLQNRGRPENQQRVEAAVLAYAERAGEGSKFPAVLVWETKDGLEVLDGCQRLMAAEMLGATSFAAFRITCKDTTARKLRIWSNTAINGEAIVDPEWSIKRMIQEFVIQGSDSVESLAAFMGRPVSDIQKRHDAMESMTICEALLKDHGKTDGAPPKVKQGVADAFVSRFRPYVNAAPDMCAKILTMPPKYGLTNGDTEELFDALLPKKFCAQKAATSLRSKMRDVQQSQTWVARLKGPRKVTPATKVVKAVAALETVCKGMRRAKASFHIEDQSLVAEMHEKILESAKVIRSLCDSELKAALDKSFDGSAFYFHI